MEIIAQLVADFVAEYGILATIVFGLIWDSGKRTKEQSKIMQGMIENQAQETKQQDRLITQNGLTISKVSRLEDLFARWIETHTGENTKKNTIIETGIASIDKNTESVNTMNGKFEELKKAVTALIATINARDIETAAKFNALTTDMATVLEHLDELTKEAEAPTEPTTPTIDPGEPSIGKIKMVGKPSIGDVNPGSATYPAAGTETKSDKGGA